MVATVVAGNHIPEPVVEWSRCGEIACVGDFLLCQYLPCFAVDLPFVESTIQQIDGGNQQTELPPASAPGIKSRFAPKYNNRDNGCNREKGVGNINCIEGKNADG